MLLLFLVILFIVLETQGLNNASVVVKNMNQSHDMFSLFFLAYTAGKRMPNRVKLCKLKINFFFFFNLL